MSIAYKVNNLEIKRGSRKLPNETLIFNMGSAKDCPSMLLGLCEVPAGRCYARRDEMVYPASLPYRERQGNYWKWASVETLINDFTELLETKRARVDGELVPLYKVVNKLRFNESGDFYTQDCVDKLDALAEYLYNEYGIKTYGYTARSDLRFDNVTFLVKGSSNSAGNNGSTRVIRSIEEKTSNEYLCPGTCKKCQVCTVFTETNIAFLLH